MRRDLHGCARRICGNLFAPSPPPGPAKVTARPPRSRRITGPVTAHVTGRGAAGGRAGGLAPRRPPPPPKLRRRPRRHRRASLLPRPPPRDPHRRRRRRRRRRRHLVCHSSRRLVCRRRRSDARRSGWRRQRRRWARGLRVRDSEERARYPTRRRCARGPGRHRAAASESAAAAAAAASAAGAAALAAAAPSVRLVGGRDAAQAGARLGWRISAGSAGSGCQRCTGALPALTRDMTLGRRRGQLGCLLEPSPPKQQMLTHDTD